MIKVNLKINLELVVQTDVKKMIRLENIKNSSDKIQIFAKISI